MINLLSISDFRKICPVNSIVDDSLIAAAINHTQVALVPEVTNFKFFTDLLNGVNQENLTDLQKGFLNAIEPALACLSASNLVDLAGNQIHPTKVVDAMGEGSQTQIKNYYINKASAYLKNVYAFCEDNNICYNKHKSTEFCGLVLGGCYS